MELLRKRNRDEFTAEEMEAANALLTLCHLDCFLVKWAVKRRRSAIARGGFSDACITHQAKLANRSPSTPLGISWSESDEFDERAGGLQPSSKDMSVKNVPRRRLPKKKTHKELKEMVNTLSLEKSRLKKDEEQMMKTYQELQEWNYHLKSQLAAHLNQRHEQRLLSASQPLSSDRGSSHGTETFVSVDDTSRRTEHNSADYFVGTLALSTVYDEPLHSAVSLYAHEFESSSGSENGDSSRPPKGSSCLVGLPDLNAPTEAIGDVASNGFHEEMLLSRNKAVAAAEARRRRIELTRVKYAQTRKVRSR